MAASNIPVIVQGNSFSLAIPLQIYLIDDDEMVLQDYTPDPTDEISIVLKGSRRNYTYTPTVSGNVCNIDLGGYELADNYSVQVSIVKSDGQRLRSFRTDQFFIVESSDDLTQEDIVEGLEENVIYLNSSIFVAGAEGRGIASIVKTSTSGLVDTYTITYTDNTTSTFTVTNGAQGEDGAPGATISSVEKTATVGKVDTYTITMTDGSTFTFDVTNGMDGVDLGLANIVNDLTTGGATNVLSAEMGKDLNDKFEDLESVDVESYTRYANPGNFGAYSINNTSLSANAGYWCSNPFIVHNGETASFPSGTTANSFALVAAENLPLTASTPITKITTTTYTNTTGADVYLIWSRGRYKTFPVPLSGSATENITLSGLKSLVGDMKDLLSAPTRESLDVVNFGHYTLRADANANYYTQVAPANRWLTAPIELKAGDSLNIVLESGIACVVGKFLNNDAQTASTNYAGLFDTNSTIPKHIIISVSEDMRVAFNYAVGDLKELYIVHQTSALLSNDVLYPSVIDERVVENGDSDVCLIMGSSLTWSGYSPKTMSWIERVNDLVDIGIVNGGHSGANLSGNITDMTTGTINLLEMPLIDLMPRYIISNNTANSTPTGKNLDEQLKQFEEISKSIGATWLVCGEEPTLINANDYSRQANMTKKGVNFFPTTMLWYGLNRTQSYAGWMDSNHVHSNAKNGATHVSMAEMLTQLYIHKSIKFYKVRENYKNGTPATSELAYSTNTERAAIWRATCPAIGQNWSPWTNDNIDNSSYNISESAGIDKLTDTEKTSEVATAKLGGDVTFYNHALVEIITPRIQATKALVTIKCSKEPTAVGYINKGQYVALTTTYSNGILSIPLEGANIQEYDKIKLIVSNTTDASFTMSKVKAVVYDGQKKPSFEMRYLGRKVGAELMTKTSVESGWTMSGNASVEQLPSAVRNYTSLNNVANHIQLDDDNASASYTQALDKTVHKVAVRVAASIFPPIQTTRASNDYTTTTQNLFRGMYYGGDLLLTINNAFIPLHIENGWCEVYAEAVIDSNSLSIELGRQTNFDVSYNVGDFPVFIHNVSVQEIS